MANTYNKPIYKQTYLERVLAFQGSIMELWGFVTFFSSCFPIPRRPNVEVISSKPLMLWVKYRGALWRRGDGGSSMVDTKHQA